MKYKVGDKVKIVSLQSVTFRGDCKDIVGNIGEVVTTYNRINDTVYKVKILGGGTFWWEESNLELIESYEEPRNYRNMKPTDLIKVSIDGFEDEIPLGDLIHNLALLSSSTGLFGWRFFKLLRNLDKDKVTREVYEPIRVHDKQEELMKDFFVIEADKANLKELISEKQNELKELQDKLNQLEN